MTFFTNIRNMKRSYLVKYKTSLDYIMYEFTALNHSKFDTNRMVINDNFVTFIFFSHICQILSGLMQEVLKCSSK